MPKCTLWVVQLPGGTNVKCLMGLLCPLHAVHGFHHPSPTTSPNAPAPPLARPQLNLSVANHAESLPELVASVKYLEVPGGDRESLTEAWRQWVSEAGGWRAGQQAAQVELTSALAAGSLGQKGM